MWDSEMVIKQNMGVYHKFHTEELVSNKIKQSKRDLK